MNNTQNLESELRGRAMTDEGESYERQDIDWLIQRLPKYTRTDCPACGSNISRYRFSKHEHKFEECVECKTVFLNPRPNSELLQEYYEISKSYAYWNDVVYPASEASRLTRIIIPRVERILDIVLRHNCKRRGMLDIGAGFGSFCSEVKKHSAFRNVVAVEPNPALASSCRQKGVQTLDQPIEVADLSQFEIDVVVAFEVIEHLHSPIELIRSASRILSDGGLLIITCPNVMGFDISMLQEKSSSVDPRHLNLFNPSSLAHLVKRCGFDILETLTPGILDAELVRKGLLNGDIPDPENPFFQQVLIDDWTRLGKPFQDFLSTNNLSSHLWMVAKKC